MLGFGWDSILRYVVIFAPTALTLLSALLGEKLIRQRGRKSIWFIIIAIGILGSVGTAIQQDRVRKTHEGEINGLRTSLDKITKQNSEQNLEMAYMRGQIEAFRQQVTALSREAINTAIGGDSFCYLAINLRGAATTWSPIFVQMGKYPLYGVQARIVNLENWNEKMLGKRDPGDLVISSLFTDVQLGNFLISVGDMAVGAVSMNLKQPIPVSNKLRHGYNVFFSARNGLWNELIRMQNVNGVWSQGLRVEKVEGATTRVIFEKIDNDFPRNGRGEIDWSFPMTP